MQFQSESQEGFSFTRQDDSKMHQEDEPGDSSLKR